MYSRYDSPGGSVKRFFSQGHMPVTTGVVIATALHFVFNFYSNNRLLTWIACDLPALGRFAGFTHYWTLLTYPIAEIAFLPTLFSCFWLWWLGGSLERSWGSATFTKFLVTITVATSAVLLLGSTLLKTEFPLAGLSLPLVGLTVAWASINPQEEILFYMVIRMKAWVLAALIVGIMLFIDFGKAPFLGLFALVNPVIGYYWVRGRFHPIALPFATGPARGPDLRLYDADTRKSRKVPLDDLRGTSRRGLFGVYKDWQQRKKLEKLWRDSGLADKDDRTNR